MSNEFSVSVDSDAGGNGAAPIGEWICRQAKFCSYAPASLVTTDTSYLLSQVADYNAFSELVTGFGGRTRVLIEDGSAKYGEPVCSASNCEALVFFDYYLNNRRVYCPVGTEMELKLAGLCTLSAGSYCCKAGSSSTLRFVHQSAPCTAANGDCPYPVTGYAFGACGATDPNSCVRNLIATEVEQLAEKPVPAPGPSPGTVVPEIPDTVVPEIPGTTETFTATSAAVQDPIQSFSLLVTFGVLLLASLR
ncbi:MAG: hypothetical protein SGARI_002959 [Bacillariaceae sp.]